MKMEQSGQVLSLLGGGFSADMIGQRRLEAIGHAVFFGKEPDTATARLILNGVPFTAQQQPYMANVIAAFCVAHGPCAERVFPLVTTEVTQLIGNLWKFIPAIVIGYMDAGAWFDKNAGIASGRFIDSLPIHIGMLLRQYVEWAPRDEPFVERVTDKWAVGRFSEMLGQYTGSEHEAENTRRIAVIVGKIAEFTKPYPPVTRQIMAQVAFRAQKFMDPSSLIRAIHSELNADRIVPKDAEAA